MIFSYLLYDNKYNISRYFTYTYRLSKASLQPRINMGNNYSKKTLTERDRYVCSFPSVRQGE